MWGGTGVMATRSQDSEQRLGCWGLGFWPSLFALSVCGVERLARTTTQPFEKRALLLRGLGHPHSK